MIRPLIKSSTHYFYWYWRRRFLRFKFLWSILQLCPGTVIKWIQIWTSRRTIICSYETRNIAFKLLMGGFCFVCCNRILLSMYRSADSFCHFFKPIFTVVKRYISQETFHQTITVAVWSSRWIFGIAFPAFLEIVRGFCRFTY